MRRWFCGEDERPDWLVFSASLLRARIGIGEAGLLPDSTSLEEEQFEGGDAIVEGFARFLMVALDAWSENGFEAVAPAYLTRLSLPGEHRLAESGDLLIGGSKEPTLRLPLTRALREPSWLDPETGGPKF